MEKITKRQARNLYNKGIEVLLVPSKMHPKGLMSVKVSINSSEFLFNNLVNHFRYYNCSKETGLRVSFYKL